MYCRNFKQKVTNALVDSIHHWKNNLEHMLVGDYDLVKYENQDCALCSIFYFFDHCKIQYNDVTIHCPVAKKVENSCCIGTPWSLAVLAFLDNCLLSGVNEFTVSIVHIDGHVVEAEKYSGKLYDCTIPYHVITCAAAQAEIEFLTSLVESEQTSLVESEQKLYKKEG